MAGTQNHESSSTGGISPPRPHGTGCEHLDSSGPYCPAAMKQLRLIHWFLPSLVDPSIRLNNITPSLHPHYETSSLLRVISSLCSTSVLSLSWVLHFEFLPYHRNDRFPRSTQELGSGSRHLYAGHRPSSIKVSPGLILVSHKPPVLTSSDFIWTPHQWFACARLPEPHLARSLPRLFIQRSPQGFLTHAA